VIEGSAPIEVERTTENEGNAANGSFGDGEATIDLVMFLKATFCAGLNKDPAAGS
jgi:hypothetical protein